MSKDTFFFALTQKLVEINSFEPKKVKYLFEASARKKSYFTVYSEVLAFEVFYPKKAFYGYTSYKNVSKNKLLICISLSIDKKQEGNFLIQLHLRMNSMIN